MVTTSAWLCFPTESLTVNTQQRDEPSDVGRQHNSDRQTVASVKVALFEKNWTPLTKRNCAPTIRRAPLGYNRESTQPSSWYYYCVLYTSLTLTELHLWAFSDTTPPHRTGPAFQRHLRDNCSPVYVIDWVSVTVSATTITVATVAVIVMFSLC